MRQVMFARNWNLLDKILNMKPLLTIVMAFLLGGHVYASDNVKITGRLVSEDGDDCASFVDVAVTKASDTLKVLYSALTDENGRFSADVKRGEKYMLFFSSLSIYKVSVEVSADRDHIDLGEIKVRKNVETIEAVRFTEQRQLITNEVDKLVYSVNDDPDSKTNNALEILRKVPRVTVDGDDKIQVNGSSAFTIYVNGKPSNMFANDPGKLLKNLPASSIKKMEVISEPGAKYDAEGVGGILNIVMNTGTIDGYNVSLNAMGSNRYSNIGGYGMIKAGKFTMSANYSYGANYNNHMQFSQQTENLNPENVPGHVSDIQHFMDYGGTVNNYGQYHFGSIEASYEIDTLNLLTLSADGHYWRGMNKLTTNSSITDINSLPVYSYRQKSDMANDFGGVSVNLDYQHIFKDNPDEMITLSYKYDYTPNNSSNFQEILERTDPDGYIDYMRNYTRYKNIAYLNEHTAQFDYSTKLKKMHVIETGVKYIFRDNNSSGEYECKDNPSDAWMPDASRENTEYRNGMHIAAAYFSYGIMYKQIGLKVGVRDEYSMQSVIYRQSPDQNFRASYNDLVPSVVFSWHPTMTQNINLSYNMRISRPGIHFLNPFVTELAPNIIQYGNPDLKSEHNHRVSLDYGYFSQKFNVNAGLGYSFSNNQVESYSFTNSQGQFVTTYDNIGRSQNVTMSLFLNYNPAKMTRIWASFNGYYSILNVGETDNVALSGLKNSGFTGSLYLGMQQSFKYSFRLSVNGGYFSPNVSLQGKSSGGYYYSLGLSKSFLDDNLTLSFNASNFAQKYMTYRSNINTAYMKQSSVNKMETMSFSLSLSYNFGNIHASVQKTRKSISNDDLMSGGKSGGNAGGGAGVK